MNIDNLILKNFRNHSYLSLNAKPGINLITGDNASGKTNIIEAIYYLSLGKSFKGVKDSVLLKEGSSFATEIIANVVEGKINRRIRIIISEAGRNVFINGKAINRLSELAKIINVVLFEPKDVLLFRGPPKERRKFLDINISKKYPVYLDYISQYNKLLDDRNNLLKKEHVDEILLSTNTELLLKVMEPIIKYRVKYIDEINEVLNKIIQMITDGFGTLKLIYKPFIPFNDNFIKEADAAFKKSKESDIARKSTSLGIHRDDFITLLSQRDIKDFGSQGENRIAALALKIAPYFLIEDKTKRPIVCLDDVMSELDKTKQNKLVNFLKKIDQVFITTTKFYIEDANNIKLKKNN